MDYNCVRTLVSPLMYMSGQFGRHSRQKDHVLLLVANDFFVRIILLGYNLTYAGVAIHIVYILNVFFYFYVL